VIDVGVVALFSVYVFAVVDASNFFRVLVVPLMLDSPRWASTS
jgi:hypothetical protein